MLDANFKGHIRDFALARLIDHDKLPKINLIASTLGYLAPKLPQTKKTTTKSNVYDFGNCMQKVCL
jgi:interleukin-1 receptor-associated kinase 1